MAWPRARAAIAKVHHALPHPPSENKKIMRGRGRMDRALD